RGEWSAASPDVELLSDLRGVGVFDFFEDLERGFGVFDGLFAVEFIQAQAHVVQSTALAAAIADSAGNFQLLLVVIDGEANLALSPAGSAQRAQGGGFAPAVAALAKNSERLLAVFDGPAALA